MKEQFTPGDWGFQANDSYIELHAGGKMIGNLCMGQNTCTKEELEANAQLFKAAPKMYRMVDSLIKTLDDLYPSDAKHVPAEHVSEFFAVNALKMKAKELLAEARGETT